MQEKTIAVFLASGQQGSSVIKSLLKSSNNNNTKLNIIGLVRDPSSEKCKKLLSDLNDLSNNNHKINFVKCDIHNKNEIINIFKKYLVWGVYCVTYAPLDGTKQEIIDGKLCIDAAIECNISFFIFSSVVAAKTAPQGIGHILLEEI